MSSAGPSPAGSQDPVIASQLGHPNTVSFDGSSFTVNGQRLFVWSGEFAYYRMPSPSAWLDILQKLKAGGYNAISIYLDWAYSSPKAGVYDFSGVRDIDKLLSIASQVGLYVIARPGPYINGEVDAGGLPGWSTTLPGNSRSLDPAYAKAASDWQRQVDQILVKHQLTSGKGTVLLYQIENEYCFSSSQQQLDSSYMQGIEDHARADGIAVPLFTNVCYPAGARWTSGTGAAQVSAWDAYPNGFDCSDPDSWHWIPDYSDARSMTPSNEPLYMAEFQGGSFDPWAGAGYDKCRQMDNGPFEKMIAEDAIAGGFTGLNYYMAYGGTTWGWQTDSATREYSSYDYGAPISEDRQLTSKYYDMKSLAYMTQSVPDLAATVPAQSPSSTDSGVQIDARLNQQTGAKFFIVHQPDRTSTATVSTTFTLTGADGTFVVPSKAGTSITLKGRESQLLLANYNLGGQRLVYSTSQLMSQSMLDGADLAVLYGDSGSTGETVLKYSKAPKVQVLSGDVSSAWDPATNTERLDYSHGGLIRVRISGGGRRDLVLVIGTDASTQNIWRIPTTRGPLVVNGPSLTRTATYRGNTLALTGDTTAATSLEVFARKGITQITWNGAPVAVTTTTSGSLTGQLPGPSAVSLPALTTWKTSSESPESQPAFDDSAWTVVDHTTTNNPTTPETLPVLYSDDYGYHQGDIWYRAHFTATGSETGIKLDGGTGNSSGAYGVWLNGSYLGSAAEGDSTFAFPPGAVNVHGDNVVAVLVEVMGHDEESVSPNNAEKNPRGLLGAWLQGSTASMAWRIQGNVGGEQPVDTTRGLINTGGLFGERAGWYLPNYPDSAWDSTTLPHRTAQAGLQWYRTTADLNVPAGQDTTVGVHISDNSSRNYRALIYVNGWQVGRYINNVGPQTTFAIPAGILRQNGSNTIALAVWSLTSGNGGIGRVSLVDLGHAASSFAATDVASPGWNAAQYGSTTITGAQPSVTVSAPAITSAGQRLSVRTTVANIGTATMNGANVSYTVPSGWNITPSTVSLPSILAGGSRTVTATVTVPSGATPGSSAITARVDYDGSPRDPDTFTTGTASTAIASPTLAAVFDNVGVTDDTDPAAGDFDGVGDTFSSQALAAAGVTPGSTVSVNGSSFTFPSAKPGSPDNALANGQLIAVSGKGTHLAFLGAAAGGQVASSVTVYYSDGSSAQQPISFSDYYEVPPQVSSNQLAVQTPYLNTTSGGCYQGTLSGTTCHHTIGLFAASVPLDASKSVAAVVLPTVSNSVGTPNARVTSLHVFDLEVTS